MIHKAEILLIKISHVFAFFDTLYRLKLDEDKYLITVIIIHSKYFPDSDWLKSHV